MILNSKTAHNLYNPKARKTELDKALHNVDNPTQFSRSELIQQWAMIGECYKLERNPNASEEAYKKASVIAQEIDDTLLHGSILKHLGDAMYFCNEYQKALDYYKLALDIVERLRSIPELIGLYSQAAYTCEKLGDREKEKEFLEAAIVIAVIEPIIKGNFIERFALSLADSRRYKEAAENYEKALSLYELLMLRRGLESKGNRMQLL
jgi:tetratricopeptide (TPR) repeat protein